MSNIFEQRCRQVILLRSNFLLNKSPFTLGLFSFIVGLLGNTLNIIVFTTLKTFRQTSCAFYLTAASAINIIQLLNGLLTRIFSLGYNIDLTTTSVFLCKIHGFLGFTATLIWLTCICLAVADQFASTTTRWRYLCNRRLAAYIVVTTILFWCSYGIPYLIFYDIYVPSTTGLPTCAVINSYYVIYISRVQLPLLLACLPLSIQLVFGVLIWINLYGEAARRAPLIRLKRDKQLTAMVRSFLTILHLKTIF